MSKKRVIGYVVLSCWDGSDSFVLSSLGKLNRWHVLFRLSCATTLFKSRRSARQAIRRSLALAKKLSLPSCWPQSEDDYRIVSVKPEPDKQEANR